MSTEQPESQSQPTPDPDAVEETVQTIAQALGEENLRLLRRVVAHLGPEESRAYLDRTLVLEAEGGVLVKDGSRRRTPGGVFFHLVRTELPNRVVRRLFPYSSPQTEPPVDLLTWADRLPYLAQAAEGPGETRTVKVTLIGRPKKVVNAKSCVITVMQDKIPPRQLPKGLPQPSETPITYAVYIANKQWQRVAAQIQKDKGDELIIEGYTVYDPKLQGLAVLAQSTTTIGLQRALREEQKKSSSQ